MSNDEINAHRPQRLESFGKGHAQLVEALKQFPKSMWKFRPTPQDWSIHEIVIHIADAESLGYGRCRKAIAEPGSLIMLYDQPAWGKMLHYADQNTDDALELFKWLRHSTYQLIKGLPAATWANTYQHPERGSISLDDWLITYDGHITNHIRQMQEVYNAWQVAGSPS